ncbi:chitosanase/beta-glucanase [Chitinispirillum alkaliphilum]|nr:chitosanase/beta-glucanase [Chitinispirillum alkaliphilum]
MHSKTFKGLSAAALLFSTLQISGCSATTQDLKQPVEFEIAQTISPITPNLPTGVTQQQVKEKTIAFLHYYLDKYMADVPNVEPRQSFVDWIAHQRTDPEITWADKRAMTVSEAHGYGMLAIVLGADLDTSYFHRGREDFDAFVRYFKAYPSPIDNRLMCWRQMGVGIQADGSGTLTSVVNDPQCSNATDGDMDIAYALLLAHDLWGSDGEINYKKEALRVIDGIRESNIDPNSGIILLGDWAKNNRDILGRTTRSSDFLLGHLRAFAEADHNNQRLWNKVLEETIKITKLMVSNWSNETGLVPDFIVRNRNGTYEPAQGQVLEAAEDGDYNFNACRVPWRLAADYFASGDTVLFSELMKLNRWIENKTGGDVADIKPGYYVRSGETGTYIPGRDWSDLAFSAPFLASAAISSNQQDWLDSLWQYHSQPYSWGSYYGESIQLHSLFILAGAWRMPGHR